MRTLFFTFLMVLTPAFLSAALVTWTGGGAANDWTDAANWDSGVPTAADDIVITGGSISVILSTPVTYQSLEIQSGATLTIASTGVLNLGSDDGEDTNGALDLSSSSGTIINNGAINITNAAEDGIDSRGSFTNNGTITINTYVDDGITASKVTSLFNNNGTITITNGTDLGINVREGAILTNAAGALITIDTTVDEGIWIEQTSNATVNNAGTINISNITGSGNHGIEVRSTFNNLEGGLVTITALGGGDGVRVEEHTPGVFNNAGTLIIDIDPAATSDAIENQGTFTSTGIIEIGFDNTTNELEINGNQPITFGGTVIFDIAGTSTGDDEFDQIQPKGGDFDISGATAHLDWGTYVPSIGDKFKIIDGSSTVVGPFTAITTSNSGIVTTVDYTGDTNKEVEIEVTAITCGIPTGLVSLTVTETAADLSWDAVTDASTYNWIVVAAGDGADGTTVASGMGADTTASATGLTNNTSYDLHVQADCGAGGLSAFSMAYNFTTASIVQIGDGSSSSSTRGPFQRADTNSTTVYSRWVQLFTESELADAGITSGASIAELQWESASSNVIIGNGDATLKIYVKNSDATAAVSDSWVNHIAGSSLVVDNSYNTTNNFPGANGWMPFTFAESFIYTGGTLEVAVDWDCSQVSTPVFSGNGAIKWRWASTAPDNLVVKKTSSSSPSTNVTDLKNERANIQIVYIAPPPPECAPPSNLTTTAITATSADLSWDVVDGASAYIWRVVEAGPDGMVVDFGSTADTSASATGLSSDTWYDFEVLVDCGGDTSAFSMAYNFLTPCMTPTGLTSANVTTTTVDLSWDVISGASTYNWTVVPAGEGPDGMALASGTTEDAATSVIDLTSNTSYDLHVQVACGEDNLSDFSAAYNFVTNVSMCPIPTGLASTNVTMTTADLSWNATAGATVYLWKVLAADECSDETVFDSGATTGTMVSATGLTGNTDYRLLVQAYCGEGGLSDLSMGYNFTTMGISESLLLSADGPGDTYDLIIGALAPGATPHEPPDCSHPEFGEHIDEVWDADLGKFVFRFHLHVHEDNDRCINFDRQRNEIKTYNESPENLLGVLGETVEYKWQFKLAEGFQPSAKFTHIHQLKSVAASNNEDDQPQITFTARKGKNGNPDQLELRYAATLTQITWAETDLTPFKGEWVEATETVKYGDWGEGTYALEIKKVSDCSTLFSYSNDNTRMWKTDAAFVRPKWGIYRSLEDSVDLRDEQVLFADFSIKELSATPACAAPPTYLNATNIMAYSADLSWGGVPGASAYNWIIVAAGDGAGGTAVASGTSLKTTVSVEDLADLTTYDLHVEAVCGEANTTGYSEAHTFTTEEFTNEMTSHSIGEEIGSSSSRGPIHQAGTGATTRYSRFLYTYTKEELLDAGIIKGDSITQLQWYLTTEGIITGPGAAPLKIYIKNSSATEAAEGAWDSFTMESTLALDTEFDTTNNFPGTAGWMPFTLDAPFVYDGDGENGALEIGVEFNWDFVTFTNNGAAKWRYSNFAQDVSVRGLGTSGNGYSNNLTLSSTGKQRANTQIVYLPGPPPTCPAPSSLSATNITTSSADLSWSTVENAISYTWTVVEAGAGPEGMAIDSGTTVGTSAATTNLSDLTAYDLHVKVDCGDGDLGDFSSAHTFVTLSVVPSSTLTMGMDMTINSSIGPVHQGGVSANTRYSRFNQVYSQAELSAAGLAADSKITELQWFLASTNIITQGESPFKIYIKNSSATEATAVGWAELVLGLTPVVDRVFNTTTNLPGVEGWLPFTFDVPFVYTGGALEVLVEWEWPETSFTNGEPLDWRYSTTPGDMVVRALGSGSHKKSNLSFSTSETSPPTYRANMQIIHTPPVTVEECPEMEQLDQADIPSDTYRANMITSKGTVENGSTVILAAQTSVTLEIDFHAKAGANFTAKIEDCPPAVLQEEETLEEFTRFTPINTPQIDTKLDIKVYPNPINQQLNVELQAFEKGQVRLFDGTGKTHITRIITGNTTLNTNNLPVGIYFLQVFDENSGQVFTRKILKQ